MGRELGADAALRDEDCELAATTAAAGNHAGVLRYLAREAPPGSFDVGEAARAAVVSSSPDACVALLELDREAARAAIAREFKSPRRGHLAMWGARELGYPLTAAHLRNIEGADMQAEARQWLDGRHPKQLERRAVEEALLARPEFPAEVARFVGDFCLARAW